MLNLFQHLRGSRNKFGMTHFFALLLVILFTLTSCENFLTGGKVKKEIEDAIAYNNAPSVTVYLKSDAAFGEFLSDGEKSFKVGYDTQIQFSVNTDSYVFDSLEAVVRTSPETSRKDSVQFTLVEADAKKGIYKINVKILEKKNDIMIRAVCKPLAKIGTISPALDANGCLQDSEITIPFNKKMDPASFKDENGKIKGISITTADGEDLSDYFDEPIFDSENKSLNILPLCLIDDTKYLLPPDGTKNTLNIEVSYTFINVKDADGFDFTANGTHSYKINKSFSEQENVIVIVQNPAAEKGSFLSSGEKSCIVRFGFDIEFTLNKEAYIFQGFEAISQNNVLDESYVSFENRQYDDETGIYKARVRVYKTASDIIIRPKCQLITNADVTITKSEKGTKSINPADKTKVQSFINRSYSLSFEPDEDYEFIRWELYDIKTDDTIPNGTYVTIKDFDEASTTYVVTQIPETEIELGLRPIVAERPQLISNTPQNSGILKDSSIQVLFDHDMDEDSIYFTKPEVVALIQSGIAESQFLPPLEEDELTGTLNNHYGYIKNGKTCYKNISLENNKTGENLNDKFEAPFFENARTLSIPASKEDGKTLDDYTQVLVTIEKDFFYCEPVDGQKKKPVTLRVSKKWTYQVTNQVNEDALVFQKKKGTELFTLKLESTDSDELADEIAPPTIESNGNGIRDLNFLKIKNEKPTLYCDVALTDNNGSGPIPSFTINYERIKESDYITNGTGEKATGSFTRNYTITTSQDAVYKGDLELDLPADGLYRIWFDFADRSDKHFIYPDSADEENSNKGFYVVKDMKINMAAPTIEDPSDKNGIKLKLVWEPCIDFVKTKIRYKKNTETDWSEYDEFTSATQKEYGSLALNTDYDFEIVNMDYAGNTQTISLGQKTSDYCGMIMSGTPEKTVYLRNETFDDTGLTISASLTNGYTWKPDYTTTLESENLCVSGKSITISYTYSGITLTENVNGTFYVAEADALTYSPVKLNNYNGTKGTDGTYYKFGDYPQTIKQSSVIVGDTPVYNGWYLGDDGYFYDKCTATVCEKIPEYEGSVNYIDSDYTCSNKLKLVDGNEYYFKVEPIKWRVLNPDATSNDKILMAENMLTGNIPWYLNKGDRYTYNGTIFANNYKYSTVRAWLNGKYENDDGQEKTYENNGFLQKAFSASAQNKIKNKEVDNSADSTFATTETGNKTNRYACSNTTDKIFLLSVKEITTTDFGFNGSYYGSDNARIRKPTDWAKAHNAFQEARKNQTSRGGRWFLRSPTTSIGTDVSINSISENGSYRAPNCHNKTTGIVPALCVESSDLPD